MFFYRLQLFMGVFLLLTAGLLVIVGVEIFTISNPDDFDRVAIALALFDGVVFCTLAFLLLLLGGQINRIPLEQVGSLVNVQVDEAEQQRDVTFIAVLVHSIKSNARLFPLRILGYAPTSQSASMLLTGMLGFLGIVLQQLFKKASQNW